jgi:hypothetical protein
MKPDIDTANPLPVVLSARDYRVVEVLVRCYSRIHQLTGPDAESARNDICRAVAEITGLSIDDARDDLSAAVIDTWLKV